MRKYIIIYELSYDKLERRVDEAMENGYKPHGSLVFRPTENRKSHGIEISANAAFIQPMVLKD